MPASRKSYPIGVIVLVGAMVAAGALALSLIVTGNPAFPVKVFGTASVNQQGENLARLVRPEEHPALPVGHFAMRELLPMPVMPKWTYGPGDETVDPLYRTVHDAGATAQLENARLATRTGRRAEALQIYETLGRKFPNLRPLLIERASVMATFGLHAEATSLLLSELSKYPGDVGLRMTAAHNAWWSNQAVLADSIVGLTLEIEPTNVEALRLRQTIRSTTQPSLRIAREWAANGGAREQLILARAYVGEADYAKALHAFDLALQDPRIATDSLILEAASAAAAADSVEALERLTQRYLTLHPEDRAAELRLARAFGWRGDYAKALAYYNKLDLDQPGLRLEVAQILIWSGNEVGARRELELLVRTEPDDGTALKLLGDLASWRGDWDQAVAYYGRAEIVQPGMPDLAGVLALATENREKARVASQAWAAPMRPVSTDATVAVDGFTDNLGFRWATTSGSRSFLIGGTSIRATGLHQVFEGSPTGALTRNPGVGARIEASREIAHGLRADLSVGGDQYALIGTNPTYGFGLTAADIAGMRVTVEGRRESGARMASTIAALQARAQADVVAVTASRSLRGWAVWARAERDAMTSIVGGVTRLAGSASVTRAMTSRLSLYTTVSGLHVDRAAPELPEFGRLLWAPEYYVEPTLGASYQVASRGPWRVGGTLQGGYAFSRERANDQRFPVGPTPTALFGTDVGYVRGRWDAALTARYGGAVKNGYRSGTLGIRATYRIGK